MTEAPELREMDDPEGRIRKLVEQKEALLAALTLAEDVLSRSPYSNHMWPGDVHPQIGITQIRDALELARQP